ncbi:hypothetical protein MIND_00079600 [Mycena indigotica]|uniref:Uncharacterized protein n=1 Tax=Mycena indigotica TaxID=2126181 RepID=A0A8H6TFA4_9AGAR|nr:uncharacterized protein MIND_00079600 [Mycena indigotica]KAF7315641.1 hypothetical protein MIND_00079600 [Mycena indigotica]
MVFTSKRKVEPIPQLDLLSFLFDGPSSLAKEDTVLHAEAANPNNFITKAQARVLTRRIAYVLRNRFGIGENGSGEDIVVVMSTGQIMLPILFMAIIAAGGVASLASPSFRPEELARQIQQGSAKLCISCAATEDILLAASRLTNTPSHRCLVLESTAPWRLRLLTSSSRINIVGNEELEWKRITSRKELDDSLICLLYSSGTTGPPKGVMMSHTNMVSLPTMTSVSLRETWQKEGKYDYRTLAHLPTAHVAGVLGYFCLPFHNGGVTYWMPKFDFLDFLKYNEQLKITTFFSVPPIYLLLVKSPMVKNQFKALRHATAGAAPMGKDLQSAACSKLGVTIAQTWGLSETSGSVTLGDINVQDPSGSVGLILPRMELRIVDDDGKECAPNTPGEILVRGPTISNGYYNNPAANAETFQDGFLCTGDIGYFQNDRLYIVDRKKELIKYKGLQIAPAELEATLLSHPRILDAGVVGVYSTELATEVPRAYVVADPKVISAEEIQAFIKGRLASYKQLRGGVVFIPAIPKLPSGKILRKDLRMLAAGKAKL